VANKEYSLELGVWSWELGVGSWELGVGSLEMGDGRWEFGVWRWSLEFGDGSLEFGDGRVLRNKNKCVYSLILDIQMDTDQRIYRFKDSLLMFQPGSIKF